MSATIEVIGLTKHFPLRRGWRGLLRPAGAKIALDRIDLAIQPGEIFGLLGPNGAGKTTLIRVLSTLLLPSDGAARVAGYDVVRHGREVRRRIGLVYGDERSFFWRLSARENLRFYAALYELPPREAERRISRLLDFVGLAGAADTRMHHYSSGMKQRVAIARGLLPDPEILFMDEPTHNLDPLASRELRDFVREEVADGRRTVLLTTNIMAEAEELCHRLAFITHGRLQFTGSLRELQERLQAEERHRLVVSGIGPAGLERLRALDGVVSVEIGPVEGGSLAVQLVTRRGAAAVPAAISQIVFAGGEVWSSVPAELSLDEMFTIAASGEPSTLVGSGAA